MLIFTLAAPAAYPTRGWSGSLHGAGGRLGGRRVGLEAAELADELAELGKLEAAGLVGIVLVQDGLGLRHIGLKAESAERRAQLRFARGRWGSRA